MIRVGGNAVRWQHCQQRTNAVRATAAVQEEHCSVTAQFPQARRLHPCIVASDHEETAHDTQRNEGNVRKVRSNNTLGTSPGAHTAPVDRAGPFQTQMPGPIRDALQNGAGGRRPRMKQATANSLC